MFKKVIFCLLIGLFTIVSVGSGAYIMCNEISTSLSNAGGGASQEENDDNKDLDENDSDDGQNTEKPDDNVDNSEGKDDNDAETDATYYYHTKLNDYVVIFNHMPSDEDYYSTGGGDGDELLSAYDGEKHKSGACYAYVSIGGKSLYTYNSFSDSNISFTSSGSRTITYNVNYDSSKYVFCFWRYNSYNPSGADGGETWEETISYNKSWSTTITASSYRGYNEWIFPVFMLKQQYTVRYHYNNTYKDQSCVVGLQYNFYNYNNVSLNNNLSKYGWLNSWVGWATAPAGVSYSYIGGNSFKSLATTNGAVVHLYEVRKRSTHLIYEGNGGKTQYGETFYKYANSYTQYLNTGSMSVFSINVSLIGNPFTRTGYNFSGWRISQSSGTLYNPNSTISVSPGSQSSPGSAYAGQPEYHIYAQWTPITYTVRYYYYGSTGDTYKTQTCTYGQEYSFLNASSFSFNSSVTQYGWQTNWVGWANSTVSTSVYYAAGAKFSNLTNQAGGIISLYALLQRSVYVDYNGNGNTGGKTDSSVYSYQYANLYGTDYVSNASIDLAQNGFTKTGYSFGGWKNSTNSISNEGTIVSLWNAFSNQQRVTMTAVWNLNTYVVRVHSYVSDGTNDLKYVGGVPTGLSYKVGTNQTNNFVTMNDSNVKNLTVSVETGFNVSVFNSNISPDSWQLMGIYAYQTTPSKIQSNPTVTVSNDADTDVYVYFVRSSANILKYTTENGGYFYFEDGYFPQSEAKEIMLDLENYKNEVKTLETTFKENEKIYLEISLEGNITNCGDAAIVIDAIKNNASDVDWSERMSWTEVRYSTLNEKKFVIVSFTAGSNDENKCNKLHLWYAFNSSSPDFSNAKIHLKIYRQISTILNQNAVKLNESIGLGNESYDVYTYNNNKYVKVNQKWFMYEPIRWRVSDYGVSSTNYPAGFDKFGSFKSNFPVVSDLVLNVSNVMTKQQFDAKQKDGAWENWSMLNSALTFSIFDANVNFANPIAQTFDKFGGVGSTNVVSGTTTSATKSKIRVASLSDISVWISDLECKASDLVKYLLGSGTYASYWTTNLGSQYGAGRIISSSGEAKDIWLYNQAGIRFAMNVSESVSFIGAQDKYKVNVNDVYNGAVVKVYNSNETILKATYSNVVNNQISFAVDFDDVIVISNLVREGYVNKGIRVSGSTNSSYNGTFTTLKFKNLHNNNGLINMQVQWAKNNDASNYYDKLSFSYDHYGLTVSVLAANLNISGEVVIPDVITHPTNGKQYTVTKVKSYGFQNCKNITSVILPDTIIDISSYAFNGCSNLKSIKLSNNVTKFGSCAFSATGLTSITLPKSIIHFNASFSNCPNLQYVYYEGTLEDWASKLSFGDTGNPLTNGGGLYINNSLVTRVDLASSSITSITANAFKGYKHLISLSLPNTVTSIGSRAFYDCVNMVGSFPTNLTRVDNYAFYNCKQLKGSVGTLSYIGTNAFAECSGLTEVTIASNIGLIGAYAFENCTNLRQTNFKGSLDQWASITFMSQKSNPISFSKNLYIGGQIVTDLSFGSSVTRISDHAFFNLTCAKSLTLSNSIKSIGEAAFKNCYRLTGALNISNYVTSIGESAFYGTRFTSIVIGNGLTRIESQTFGECRSLTSVKIGSSVSYIGERAFKNCSGLKSIYIPSAVTQIASSSPTLGAFYGCNSTLKIYCGKSSKPSTYGTYWDTAYYYVSTDGTISTKKFNVYWGYTYSQYQNATGGGIATNALANGTYNGIKVTHRSDGSFVLNGKYVFDQELIVLKRTNRMNIQAGQEIILEVEYFGGTASGEGRCIFMWRLFDSNGNRIADCVNEPTITQSSYSFKNTLNQTLTNCYFEIDIWNSPNLHKDFTFNNAVYKVNLII